MPTACVNTMRATFVNSVTNSFRLQLVRLGWWSSALAAACVLVLAAGPSFAASTLEFAAFPAVGPDGQPVAQVSANGMVLVTVRGPGAADRAQNLAAGLNRAAEDGLSPKDLTAVPVGKDYLLRAGGRPLLRVDQALAKRAAGTPESLARTWLANLRQAFANPFLAARPSPVLIPLGEQRTVQVRGRFKGALSVSADPSVVAVSVEPGQRIVLQAAAPGQTELLIRDEANQLAIPVRAAKYAGGLSRPLYAAVTGGSPSTSLASRAAEQAVRGSVRVEPGAYARLGPARVEPFAHFSPFQARVSVPVALDGPDYVPVRITAHFAVAHEPTPAPPTELLVISNNPEKLAALGLWHETAVPNAKTVRFLYHHVNASGQEADLVLELLNLSQRAARVWMTEGAGGPSPDELYVGHLAARTFLERRFQGSGFVFEVGPNGGQELLRLPMRPGQVASGLLEVASLSQADLRLRLRLAEPRDGYVPLSVGSYTPSPLLSRWQFATPEIEVKAEYRVEGRWAFVDIGNEPLVATNGQDKLLGAYGAIYRITFTLSNPTPRPASVELGLMPRGGVARAVLSVDGELIETGMVRANQEVVLARRELPPGAQRTMVVHTMPQSGSSYPVTLFVRPAGIRR